MTPDPIQAHGHSIRHRDEILASEICGCFFCCQTFTPAEITDWIDERTGDGHTALCPHCGVDSVLGSNSGYPITPEFLSEMRKQWFC
jgi:hypothetical protein